MLVARRVGAVLLVAAAFAIWFLLAPDVPDTPSTIARDDVRDRASQIDSALADAELNEGIADSAPQQQVVNGWVARDLLEIIASQQNESLAREEIAPPVTPVVPPDERIPALVGLLVVGVALGLATTPRPAAPVPAPAPLGATGSSGSQGPWGAPAPS